MGIERRGSGELLGPWQTGQYKNGRKNVDVAIGRFFLVDMIEGWYDRMIFYRQPGITACKSE